MSDSAWDQLVAENTALKVRIIELEATVRMREDEIRVLRKRKLNELRPDAVDRFRRPLVR